MVHRRYRGRVEELIELASRLPWPISLGLAIAAFAALTLMSRHFLGAPHQAAGGDVLAPLVNTVYGTLASLGRWVIPLLFLVGSATSWWKARHRNALLERASVNPLSIEELSWRDFERLIGQVYREEGYAVAQVGGEGPDGGIDLILRREGRETLLQCKQWRRQRVGVATIRELRGVMAERGATEGIVVGLCGFTEEAQAFARAAGIKLLDREGLGKLVKRTETLEPMPETDAGTAATCEPRCPQCGSPMVKRIARQGSHTGRAFFGCSQYPHCRGIVGLS
jgi:restriction system protein